MTIGISKEYLEEKQLQAKKYNDSLTIDLLNYLINNCKDLDPWLPIAEAPKDKPILLLLDSGIAVTGYWSTYHWVTDIFNEFDCGGGVNPTHYKLLP